MQNGRFWNINEVRKLPFTPRPVFFKIAFNTSADWKEQTYYFRTVTKCPTHGCEVTKIWWLRKGNVMRWPDIAESSSKFPFILFFLRDLYSLSALDDQSVNLSKVMSVKSAIFNSLFTTAQKIKIAISRSLTDFYSNIQALAMLSRCSLELSMGVSCQTSCLLLYKVCIRWFAFICLISVMGVKSGAMKKSCIFGWLYMKLRLYYFASM